MAYSEDDLKQDLENQEYEFGFTTDQVEKKIRNHLANLL